MNAFLSEQPESPSSSVSTVLSTLMMAAWAAAGIANAATDASKMTILFTSLPLGFSAYLTFNLNFRVTVVTLVALTVAFTV